MALLKNEIMGVLNVSYIQLVDEASRVARTMPSWADFADYLFNSKTGLLAKAHPTRAERDKFAKSEESLKIQKLLEDLMRKHGVISGAVPKKSGRFVVRMPKTLHEMLETEAEYENVSLNQLVVAKLSMSLQSRQAALR